MENNKRNEADIFAIHPYIDLGVAIKVFKTPEPREVHYCKYDGAPDFDTFDDCPQQNPE